MGAALLWLDVGDNISQPEDVEGLQIHESWQLPHGAHPLCSWPLVTSRTELGHDLRRLRLCTGWHRAGWRGRTQLNRAGAPDVAGRWAPLCAEVPAHRGLHLRADAWQGRARNGRARGRT